MAFETGKVKSASKQITVKGEKLSKIVLSTMKTISDIVGSTLGPGGSPVLIERFEHGLPPIVSKDGVSVFQSLGFHDPVQQVIMEATRDIATRTAKEAGDGPQPLWSKILTPSGFVEMREAKVGMSICGTNGTVQKIVGVFDKGKKEIIKVELEQGQMVECCEDHLWTVTTNYGATKTITTKEMMENYKQIQADGYHKHRYFTPNTEVEFSKKTKDLPLDPYLLGILLGDGSLTDSGSVELSMGSKKEHIINNIVLPDGISFKTSFSEEKHCYRVKITGKNANGETIRDLLEKVGLRNTNSYTKFIPKEYLLSSKENRTALLKGLLDTDGSINARGLFEFSTVNEQLAADFKFLCKSLGKNLYSKLYIRKDNDGSYSKKPIYRFSELKGYKHGVKIVNISKTGEFTEMRCIKVSNMDNLYITNDFVVTHNTTTATILGEAIARLTDEFCKKNPKFSPQKVVRKLESVFAKVIEPTINSLSTKIKFQTPEGKQTLFAVAALSANGDKELAKAVMDCFELVGDDGNVTITEASGPARYEVERIDGYPIGVGYEECCGKFYPKFINDAGTQKCIMENAVFIIYHGVITEIQTILPIVGKFGNEFALKQEGQSQYDHHNLVIIATGFSEDVIARLAVNFPVGDSVNIFPLIAPRTAVANSQLYFLEDMCAITGASLFEPLNKPLDTATLEDLGPGVKQFEASRDRAVVIGLAEGEAAEEKLLERVSDLESQLANPVSEYDRIMLQERIGKITGGIAKLRVVGSSNSDIREKKDRADDAVCAVRGALKHGCLPGGGWTLLKLISILDDRDELVGDLVVDQILKPALLAPVIRLLSNCGITDEGQAILQPILTSIAENKHLVYDAYEQKHIDAFEGGILDSTPAVLEALRNSLAGSGQMGTLGGIVCFGRDPELERAEARSTLAFLRDSVNEANERP